MRETDPNERVSESGRSKLLRGAIFVAEIVASEETESLDEDGDEFRVGSLERGEELEGGAGDGDVGVGGEAAEVADGVVDDVRGRGGEALGNGASSGFGFWVEVAGC